MSNTYHNTQTLSQSTPYLYHITSTHNTLSRNTPTQPHSILFVTYLPHGGRERGTDNGMEETKVGESEGKEASGQSDEWRQAATEKVVSVRKTEGRWKGGKERWNVEAKQLGRKGTRDPPSGRGR